MDNVWNLFNGEAVVELWLDIGRYMFLAPVRWPEYRGAGCFDVVQRQCSDGSGPERENTDLAERESEDVRKAVRDSRGWQSRCGTALRRKVGNPESGFAEWFVRGDRARQRLTRCISRSGSEKTGTSIWGS